MDTYAGTEAFTERRRRVWHRRLFLALCQLERAGAGKVAGADGE
jgi:hypothetical protein